LQTKEKRRIIRSKIDQRKATMSNDENIKNESEIGSSPLSRTKIKEEVRRMKEEQAAHQKNVLVCMA
jgi:hypothetical protein